MHIFTDIKGKGKYALAIPELAIFTIVHNSSRFHQIGACLSTWLYAKQTSILEWEPVCGSVLGNIKYGDGKCAQIQPNSQSLLTFTLVSENHKMFRAGRGQRGCPSLCSPGHHSYHALGTPSLFPVSFCSFTVCQTTVSWGERIIFAGDTVIFIKYIYRKSNYSSSLTLPLPFMKNIFIVSIKSHQGL